MDSYEQLLDKLKQQVPDKTSSGERFVLPQAELFIQGSKTIIRNFDAICQKLRRDPNDLMKYLFKELATPGVLNGTQLVLQAKVNARLVNEKISDYFNGRVVCKECGRPDTDLKTIDGVTTVVCQACGAKRPASR
ncbi:translation initiation factor IF-2 subunit beta [Candidatus Micrarchaeota archaeon]|nr:translation initiation factor IF-2 subunit beta [Candidatus Micrarchaeota archaeon]